jgi:hypothetical protein
MSESATTRNATAGDRAVAIAGFLAILLTGFFGDEPDVRPPPTPAPVQAAQR